MIRLNNIVATYTTVRGQVDAVDGVDLTIPAGKIVGVAGESGCGKTTLLKVIYGDLIYPLALRQGNVEYEIEMSPGHIVEGKIRRNEGETRNGGQATTSDLQITTKNIKDYWFKHISYIPQASMSSLNPVVSNPQAVCRLFGRRSTQGQCP